MRETGYGKVLRKLYDCKSLGEVIAETGEREETITAEIDLSLVAKYRKDMPALKDRREEIY